jgi:hypothetical protein
MRSYTICVLQIIIVWDFRPMGIHLAPVECMQFYSEILKGRYHLGDLSVDGRIIL